MPQHKSAWKRMRTSAKQRARNREIRSTLRAALRRFREAPPAERTSLLSTTTSAVDNAVRRGVLKENTASRIKSRMAKRLNREQATQA